jgi:hypothetical protein
VNYSLAEMERMNATATPWTEIERSAREIARSEWKEGVEGHIEEAEAISALAERIISERPYIGLAGAHDLIALAIGDEGM